MSACIGWLAEPACEVHGQFHGCTRPDKHTGRHECACGAVGKASNSRTPASLRGTRNQHAQATAARVFGTMVGPNKTAPPSATNAERGLEDLPRRSP